MTTIISIKQHETPAELFDALDCVFGSTESNGTRWVEFESRGVSLTFFAASVASSTETDEAES
jgi:hypothetical protein